MTMVSTSASAHRRVARRVSLVLWAILAACLSPQELQGQVGQTRSRMRDLREAIAQYAQAQGQFPESLQEICRDGSPCRLMPPSQDCRGVRDGWGRPFLYRLVDGEYELRSLGADGRPSTDDDLVFRPSLERAWAGTVSGCYKTAFGGWPEFPKDVVLVLDTTALDPGAFVLRPVPEPYDGGSWKPRSQDSLLLEWFDVHSSARIRLRQFGDSLVGMAERPRHKPTRIVAHRTDCPDGSSSK